jgi:exodeoxyribonuclease VII small subunit
VSDEGQPDFEAALVRLERIVQELESPQLVLDRALQLFDEGLALGQQCSALLERARARVEQLLERHDGGAETRPLEPPERP